MFILYVFFLYICMCTTHGPDALQGQKRASDLSGLESWMFGSHRVSAGN